MVIDDHFLFDMMMTVMMHYSGNEDHFFLCHRHWDLNNLLHLALNNALLRDHLWPLPNFLPLMWDVKLHNHLLLDMVMTMVVHDRWNMHNLFLCHRDWHFTFMLALSGRVGSGRVRSVRSGQVGSGRVRSGQVGSGQVHSSIVADNKPLAQTYGLLFIWPSCEMPNAWVMMIYG